MFGRGRHPGLPVLTGHAVYGSKLTDKQALEIIARYNAGGVTQSALSAEYGVSQNAVSVIVRGKRRSLQ